MDRDPPASDADSRPWPAEVLEVFEGSATAEYASLTRTGSPVTVPTTPYVGAGGRTLDVTTGLTYPAKAERARRDPRVCLLFADPVGAGPGDPATVMVQGLATVRDSDLQANTDRYVRISREKYPAAMKGTPRFVLARMGWYFARIWIEITPLHVLWWPNRNLDVEPRSWHAPEGTAAPLSDPAPSGAQPPAWLPPPASWRDGADRVGDRLPLKDLTVIDANGFPLCLPVMGADLVDDGFVVRLGPGSPAIGEGPACLTMHTHAEVFTGQENRTFVGRVVPGTGRPGTTARVVVDRVLADWSIVGNQARSAVGFLRKGRTLSPRLRTEAARRFQPVPEVRFPTAP
ncbi:MAG TPA: pyridoxamine 5'-phosphate oxidase family protein [Acidimicrobiales bacterium]|nr:pyridoxamine 5'-phosphate oxidase family protein [Acidimicrobiales bacterium]